MPTPQDFQSFTASVFPSPAAEVVIAKQPVLADYGREVRNAISQLPPEATRSLLGEYGLASPTLLSSIEGAILQREFAHERATREADVSRDWLNAADLHTAGIDESVASADDTWNVPPRP